MGVDHSLAVGYGVATTVDGEKGLARLFFISEEEAQALLWEEESSLLDGADELVLSLAKSNYDSAITVGVFLKDTHRYLGDVWDVKQLETVAQPTPAAVEVLARWLEEGDYRFDGGMGFHLLHSVF